MALFNIPALQKDTAQGLQAEGSVVTNKTKLATENTMPASQRLSKISTNEVKQKVVKEKKLPKIPQSDSALAARLDEIFKNETCSLVTTEEELAAYINKSEVFGLDTETSSLAWYNLTLAGFSLGTASDSIYVPLNHEIGQNYTGDKERLIKLLLQGKYYGFNSKFDLLSMRTYDERLFNLDFVGDGYLAIRLTDNNLTANLKDAYKEHIDPTYIEYSYSSLFSRPFTTYDPKDIYKYAAVDARKHYKVAELFESKIKSNFKLWKLYTKLELPLVKVIASMEIHGLRMDEPYLYKLKDELEASKAPILEEIRELVKEKSPQLTDFNPGSTKQLKEAFKARGIELASTGEEVLESIGDDDILASKILQYRGVAKSISAFTTGLLEYSAKEGELTIAHPGFNQYGANCVTGETSILTPKGVCQISSLLPDLKNRDYTEYQTSLINRYRERETTSHAVKFESIPTIKLTVNGGSQIEGTYEHPILTLPVNSRQYSNIKENNLDTIWNKPVWKKLADIKKGDLILIDATPLSLQNIPLIETNFMPNTLSTTDTQPSYLTEDLALFLGMLYANGKLKLSRNGLYTAMLCSDKPQALALWETLCIKLFNRRPVYKTGQSVTSSTDEMGSSIIYGEDLRQLEKFQTTSKQIPTEIFQSRDSVFNSYLKGMTLDSKICNKPNSLHIAVAKEQDSLAIQQRLLAQGIYSGLWSATRKDRRSEGYGVNISRHWLIAYYDKIGVIEESKKVKDSKYSYSSIKEYKNYIAAPVSHIKHKTNTVYDFTLPETHSFCTNAFISHNTGRFSSSQFNVQQIPKDNKFRNIFIARPGQRLISVDYSQQEVRVLAALSQDPLMLSTFELKKDFYSDMGANVYDLPYEDCTKQGKFKHIRQEMKSVVLGMNYDMGAHSLAKSIHKSEDEAQEIINSLKRKYKVMYQYKAKILAFAQEHGYNETVLGRRRWYVGLGYKQRGLPRFIIKGAGEQEEEIRKLLPQLDRRELKKFITECANNKPNKIAITDREAVAFGEQRQSTNSCVQGGSADMTKLAMLAFYKDERRKALGAELACQIHDEIIIEAPEENAVKASELLAEIMNGVGFDLVGIDMGGDPNIMSVWEKD